VKYRKLDTDGDYMPGVWLENTPDTVGQAVKTRLLLWREEWFMNTSEGTPYMQDILGRNTNYDLQIKSRILGTKGVKEIIDYSSNVINRALSVTCTLSTIYGIITLSLPQ
jgi:hypothetical protein